MEKTKKKHIIRNIIIGIVLLIIVFGLIGLMYAGAEVYDEQFGERCTTYEPMMLSTDMYDGLQCEECTFTSYQGTELAGYKLYNEKNGESFYEAAANAKAVVIIAHGMGGGGFNSYMSAAAWFAEHGYVVFGYDATGNDNSGGSGLGGVPQGTEDVCAAIEYIARDDDTDHLDICLFGHSWGAYSVMNALNKHPEVKAVAEISGWNSSKDQIYATGEKMVGGFAMKVMLPFMMHREKNLYHEFSSYTAVDGFNKTDAGIVIVHSADDGTVKIEDGYDIFYKEFSDDPRFTFIKYEDRNHSYVYHSQAALDYIKEFNKEFDSYFNITERSQKIDPDEHAEYMKKNLDLKRFAEVDEELFAKIDEVYTEYINK